MTEVVGAAMAGVGVPADGRARARSIASFLGLFLIFFFLYIFYS
jgi:sulfite exporter TauE/SafE